LNFLYFVITIGIPVDILSGLMNDRMIRKIKSEKSLVTRAYKGLLEMMADGTLRQADIVSHRDLAARMRMSKLPVGMALKRLEQEGLVESIDRIGTRICRVDAEAMWGMLQWRVALECQVVRLACEWIDRAGRRRLTDMAKKVDDLFSVSPEASLSADVEFHLFLGDLSRCKKLRMELDRLNIFQIKQMVCETVSAAAKTPSIAPPSHVELAKGIIRNDPDKAERLMRHHLEGSMQMYGFVQWYRETYRKKPHP
jgi:GntR family transcriptional regulator, vanillate catabolism transcriptional regulator